MRHGDRRRVGHPRRQPGGLLLLLLGLRSLLGWRGRGSLIGLSLIGLLGLLGLLRLLLRVRLSVSVGCLTLRLRVSVLLLLLMVLRVGVWVRYIRRTRRRHGRGLLDGELRSVRLGSLLLIIL